MAIPLKHDLSFYRGDTENLTIRWKNPDGTPVPNLEYATVYMDIRKSITDGAVLSKEGVIDTELGEVSFDFSKEDTELLMGGTELMRRNYIYDVEYIFAAGAGGTISERTTLMRGKLTIHRDVTQTI